MITIRTVLTINRKFNEDTIVAHVHGGSATGKYLGISIGLTLVFVTGEFIVGLFSNSLALISDAAHNFADALSLILSWYAVRISRRAANDRKTFGYHRASILAALVNATSLVAMGGWIIWEAIHRLQSPEPIATGWMIGVALAAVVVNLTIGYWLHAESKDDLNIRAAFLHQVGDAVAAVGVALSGVLILVTGALWLDAVVSILIGGMILGSSRGILLEAIDVLLEAVPRHVDLNKLVPAIEQVPGVQGVHHLHVWTISSGMIACSCHLRVEEQPVSEAQKVQAAVAAMLEHSFHITHTTIQMETIACPDEAVTCELRKASHSQGCDHEHSHDHTHGHSH